MSDITEAEALSILTHACRLLTQRQIAKQLDIGAAYLNDVLQGRRDPARVLRRFGYERVVRYRKVSGK